VKSNRGVILLNLHQLGVLLSFCKRLYDELIMIIFVTSLNFDCLELYDWVHNLYTVCLRNNCNLSQFMI